MKLTIIAFCLVVIVNILAIDAGLLRVDNAFRHQRDRACSFYFSPSGNGYRGEFSIVSIRVGSDAPNIVSFYGCDANGHNYRMWVH